MNAPYVIGASCELLVDEHYVSALRQAIQTSVRRCYCTMFIIDLKTRCVQNCVSNVLDDLGEAVWRGVDVRVLIGGSRSTFEIAEAAAIAVAHLEARSVPSRWLTEEKGVRGSHSKIVVADESVLLGSHNWSPGSFQSDVQDSVLIRSAPLAEYMASQIERRWAEAASDAHG